MTLDELLEAARDRRIAVRDMDAVLAACGSTHATTYVQLAQAIARRFQEDMSAWQACDSAINALWSHWTLHQAGEIPPELHETFLAFDEGETRHEGQFLNGPARTLARLRGEPVDGLFEDLPIPICAELPESVWLNVDIPRAALEKRLDGGRRASDGWIMERTCRECGQRWRLDPFDKYAVDLAVKVPAFERWTYQDDQRARLEYLRRSYGGDGGDKCVWSGCDHRALRGGGMCAEHAFAAGCRAKGA